MKILKGTALREVNRIFIKKANVLREVVNCAIKKDTVLRPGDCRELCTEPAPITSGFLTYHDDPERAKLPLHRIYPVGQRLMLADWNLTSEAVVKNMAAHGLNTVIGASSPYGGSSSNSWKIAVNCAENGLRYIPLLAASRPGDPSIPGDFEGLGNMTAWMEGYGKYYGRDVSEFIPQIREMHGMYSQTPHVEVVDGFLHAPEEIVCGLYGKSLIYSTAPGKPQGYAVQWMRDMDNSLISEEIKLSSDAGQPLPLYRSITVTSTYVDFTCWSNRPKARQADPNYADWESKIIAQWDPKNGVNLQKRVNSSLSQVYVDRSPWGGLALIYNACYNQRVINAECDAVQQPDTGHKRITHIILSYIFATTDKNDDYYRRLAKGSIWLCLLMEMESISVYRSNQGKIITPPRRLLQVEYYKAIKVLTDHDFEKAMLWGTKNPANKLSITHDKPLTYVFSDPKRNLFNLTLVYADRQFGNTRYFAGVNTTEDTVKVTIRNLPTGTLGGKSYEIVDCHTGGVSTLTSSTKIVTLGAWGVFAYKVRLQGWTQDVPSCGAGDNVVVGPPPLLPSITAQPTDQTVVAGLPVSFTVGYANGTGVQWYWRNLVWDPTMSWRAISGAMTAVYNKPITNVNMHNDEYMVIVKGASGTSVTSRTVWLKITSAPIAAKPSGDLADAKIVNSKATLTVTNIKNTTSFKWYFQFAGQTEWWPRDADTKSSLYLSSARNGYHYKCELKGPNGTTFTRSAVTYT